MPDDQPPAPVWFRLVVAAWAVVGVLTALSLGSLSAGFGWEAGVAEACLQNGTGPGGCELPPVLQAIVVAWGLGGVAGAVALLYASVSGIRWAATERSLPRGGWAAAVGVALLAAWLILLFAAI